ncbi:MAG: hypothetical protein UFG06_13930 [Lachnospiraceae bacterium]|nr:hypothetical protein [Lachnospiraceae bacterium]
MSRVLPYNAKQWEVPALLDGRRTVARCICKDGNKFTVPDMGFYNADKRTYAVHSYADKEHIDKLSIAERTCPICPGDILYVRETVWQKCTHSLGMDGETTGIMLNDFRYVSTDKEPDIGFNFSWVKRPSIRMPKEAARIWLKVTDVRVERLQDISGGEILKEGIEKSLLFDGAVKNAFDKFKELWNSTIKKSDIDRYGWDANPWVWVIEFERCEKPEGV